MIPVTRTFLPPFEEFTSQIEAIWESGSITNRGNLVVELESRLKAHLDVPNVTITTNGTLPLQIALKVVAGMGEVITTPFSFIATTASIMWQNCIPVFVDIHPDYLTIDETKIEAAITSKTTAILATHVFGNPCKVEEIEFIAKRHGLKVIYDAAHCFGVKYKGDSIFNYGDISTCSFHATKLFHTAEGGALFCRDKELNEKLFYCHSFGYNGNSNILGLGINAKMSELHASIGLTVLPYIERIIAARKEIVEIYSNNLRFLHLKTMVLREDTDWNYSYYPIILKDENSLLRVQEALNEKKIFPRRYFYPSLNTLNFVEFSEMKISQSISERILCLPLFVGLEPGEALLITQIINKIIEEGSVRAKSISPSDDALLLASQAI